MPKYSTGNNSGSEDPNDENASCVMCGSTDNLTDGKVAGANVIICHSCHKSQDIDNEKDNENKVEGSRGNSTSSTDTRGYTISNPDSSWVEKDRPDYQEEQTPYLKKNYYDILVEEIDGRNTNVETIAEETGLHKETIMAVIDGNAVSAGVGRSAIVAIENYLDIQLRDEV